MAVTRDQTRDLILIHSCGTHELHIINATSVSKYCVQKRVLQTGKTNKMLYTAEKHGLLYDSSDGKTTIKIK